MLLSPWASHRWSAIAKLAALLVIVIACIVLVGWALNIPALKALLPGTIEMKPNTAVGLALSAFALFILADAPTKTELRLARAAILALMTIVLATLSQSLTGWNLGIDELLFLDTNTLHTTHPGRMAPLTIAAFIALGIALFCLPFERFKPLASGASVLVVLASGPALLGYLWNIPELVTDRLFEPMALNTALAFTLLGSGTLCATGVTAKIREHRDNVEIKIMLSFIVAFVVLFALGGYTYKAATVYEEAAKWAYHTQEVRTALGRLYGNISDMESAQRSYLLTGQHPHKEEFLGAIEAVRTQQGRLQTLIADSAIQRDNFGRLEQLIGQRTTSLLLHIGIFERHGLGTVADARSLEDGIRTMREIRGLTAHMDQLEIALLKERKASEVQGRAQTLTTLLLTLGLVVALLVALFLAIRSELVAHAAAERRLLDAKNEAEHANRTKDSFLATMSHEIRTPLTGMLGMLELLSMTSLTREQFKTLDAAWESGRNLLRIVNDILDWSKIEEGRLELSPQSTAIPQLLQDVVNTYSRLASSKNLILHCRPDCSLSPAHLVDPLRLSQVLNNFVSNAIRFTPAGEVEIRAILLERADGHERIQFSVRDSGIGISEEDQLQIFQKYRQGSVDTARMYGGTGLGLAICQRLAELMGGRIALESELGHGSIFSLILTLPVSDAPVVEISSSHQEIRHREISPLFNNRSDAPWVLVVDDHPINRDLLENQLKVLGMRTESAEHGKAALEKWKTGRFSVIVTDCHMPEMDGYQLTREVRRIEAAQGLPRTAVLGWTANALAEENERCADAGMDDLLVKPASLTRLKEKLARYVAVATEADDVPLPETAKGEGQEAVQEIVNFSALEQVAPEPVMQSRILGDFKQHIRQDMTKLEEARGRESLQDVRETAHRMKGSSRMVGAEILAEACLRLEKAAEDGDPAAVDAAYAALQRAVVQFEAFHVSLANA